MHLPAGASYHFLIPVAVEITAVEDKHRVLGGDTAHQVSGEQVQDIDVCSDIDPASIPGIALR